MKTTSLRDFQNFTRPKLVDLALKLTLLCAGKLN